MTTYSEDSVTCGSCGNIFQHYSLNSTNAFGSMDLDTRPPEMQRSTMDAWIQRCPSCGYCSSDASVFNPDMRDVLSSPSYRAQLADESLPQLAATFACAGLLHESNGQINDAGWAYLHTAWLLDDELKTAESARWRSRAADAFLGSMKRGTPIVPQPGESEVIVVDCLRRAGRGDEALRIIDSMGVAEIPEVIRKVFTYQRGLILKKDLGCHTVGAALKHST